MKWTVKLGENYDYEDYDRLLKNHELDEIMPAAQDVVAQFMERYPTIPISEVTLVINKDATVETKMIAEKATPGINVKIEIGTAEKPT